MDRRFVCEDCGTKWFIHEDLTDEPDLTECGRCGGPLVRFLAGSVPDGYGSRPDVPGGEVR
jgi:predicted nucleic acid-binding Zn ribbon protein